MGLTGNRAVQKWEIERRMRIHNNTIKNAKPTEVTHWSVKPTTIKSHDRNRRKRNDVVLSTENEKFMNRLYDILISDRNISNRVNRDSAEVNRIIRAKSKKTQRDLRNKKIEGENTKLQKNISKLKSSYNKDIMMKDYKQHCKFVQTLRNKTSNTALHLMSPAATSPSPPRIASPTLPAWYQQHSQRPKSAACRSHHISSPSLQRPKSASLASFYPTSPPPALRRPVLDYGLDIPEDPYDTEDIFSPPKYKLEAHTPPKPEKAADVVEEEAETSVEKPRAVLTSHRQILFLEMVISASHPDGTMKYLLRTYDVGKIYPASTLVSQNDEKPTDLIPLSAGLLFVASPLHDSSTPLLTSETERDAQLFISLMDLKKAVDNDSLYRKLNRIRLRHTTENLYNSISDALRAVGEGLLSDFIVKHITIAHDKIGDKWQPRIVLNVN